MTVSLYVPGNRPDRFDKALAAGADEIIIDLEDSVPEAAKAAARADAASWLRSHSDAPAWVRVNNRPDLIAPDLEMAAPLAPLGVVMPKADHESCDLVGVQLLALVESARGVLDLPDLAANAGIRRLALGEADLCADLGIEPSPDNRELWAIRSQMVTVSAANGLDAPTGPVFTDLNDLDRLRESSEELRRQGFGGRSAIHPSQLEVIADVFAPTAAESVWARAVISAYEDAGADSGGVAVVDGEFVDAAVVRRARRLLAKESR
ncbi:MAG: HpcH/HpaI aldolase/citrate lyase family protein [Acidimicrobiales bacterium]